MNPDEKELSPNPSSNFSLLSLFKSKRFLFLAGLVLLIILIFLSSLFDMVSKGKLGSNFPTPTPISNDTTSPEPYTFTSLQKTTIGKTSDKEVKQENKVINTYSVNGHTRYQVESKIPHTSDVIETYNGVVVFEQTHTFTLVNGSLPKLSAYEEKFGEPDAILKQVGEDWITSAYIYASKGFTLLVNRSTLSVYQVQRYTPMTVEQYKIQYADFIRPQSPEGERPL